MYSDPIQPQVDVNDFLREQTMRLGTDTVTWANAAASGPSKPRSRFTLPKVGLGKRIFIDFDGGSATAYDVTVGGGAAAVAADGRGPWQIVDGLALNVNGGGGWYDTSGFANKLICEVENNDAFTAATAAGLTFPTAPTNVTDRIFTYPAAADGRPRFGMEIPLSVTGADPLGLVMLQNDQTTVELVIRWGSMSAYAALTGGAVALMSITATAILEYYDIPSAQGWDLVAPYLQWAHWWVEERQDILSSGRDANIVTLDNHDMYLRTIHHLIINSVLNTDAIEAVRFVLNRNTTLYDHDGNTQLRRQRHAYGKDLPAFVWDWFKTRTLKDAIHADMFTDIRSVLDVTLGTTIGTAVLFSASEKLVDLGQPPARPA